MCCREKDNSVSLKLPVYILICKILRYGTLQHMNSLVSLLLLYVRSGADQGILERRFICIKRWGLVLLILSHFS